MTKRTILLVEDEVLIALAQKAALERFGYSVVVANSGERAVQTANEEPAIDLVLMDIDLGRGMDGTEAAALILRSRDIPVVFLSSHTEPEIVEKTEKITSYGYVVKSSSNTVLDASIKMAFKLFEERKSGKAKEEALRNREKELDYLLKSMLNAFVIFDSVFDPAGNFVSYRFVYVNDSYERITGVLNDDVRGKTVHEIWPGTEPEWIERYGEVAVSGVSSEFDMFHEPTKKYYHCNVYRPWNVNTRFCVVFDDITRRKMTELALQEKNEEYETLNEELRSAFEDLQAASEELQVQNEELLEAEDVLRKSEARYVSLAVNLEAGIVVHAPDTSIVMSNRKASELLGLDEKRLRGKAASDPDWKFVNEQLNPIPLADYPVNRILRTKEPIRRQVIGIKRPGADDIVWVSVNGFPQLDKGGDVTEVVISFIDITARKLVEEKNKSQSALLSMIMETSPVGITTVDADGVITYANSRAEQILGMGRSEITARRYDAPEWHSTDMDGSPLPDVKQPFALVKETLRPAYNIKHGITWPDGRCVLLSINASPLVGKEKSFDGMVATFEDITEKTMNERTIAAQLAEKSDLLKEVHHRIKNNMNAMRSMLSLQAERMTSADAAAALEVAGKRMESMEILYDQLYQSSDFVELPVRPYLSSLIDRVVSNYPACEKVGITKNLDDFVLDVKRLQLTGIIINELLTNIMKYAFAVGREGNAAVSVVLNSGRVRIAVEDDGGGMDTSVDFDNPGGFGLTLVGRLAEQLKGKARFEPAAGTRIALDFEL